VYGRRSAAALLGVLVAAGCMSEGSSPAPPAPLPDEILVRDPGLYPEGIEWDGVRARFLVSSAGRGSVTAVHDDGSLQQFAASDGITSSLGLQIDAVRGRLLVAGADFAAVGNPRVTGEAKLAIHDLETGQRLHLVDLAALRPRGRHLANDVTVDPDGNAYVTDSLSPVIYKVAPDGQADVFVDDPRLSGEGIGLNGIEYLPSGHLLVSMASGRTLYRIPLDAPQQLAEVRLSEPVAADGLLLLPDGSVVTPAPFHPAVLELRSDDGWASARVSRRHLTTPEATTTTATLRDGAVYALNAHFAEMGGPQPVATFEIFRADLTG
jgi:sugar lactone lactonase YvrE